MSETGNTLTRQYEELVDSWVLTSLAHGSRTLAELLITLPSVYPTVALDALARLLSTQRVNPQIATKILNEARISSTEEAFRTVPPARNHLPVPHPLDYDWRFEEQAIHRLVALCLDFTQAGDTIALLGTPSIFSTAMDVSALRQVMLIDSNPAMIKVLTETFPTVVIQRNDLLRDPLPEHTSAAVVLDPPWYEEHYAAFLWAASRLCTLQGKVLASLPPLGTRPGIEMERAALIDYAGKLGLVLDCLEPGALPYTMPPFEINALSAAGIFGIPENWRRGDLAIFTKSQDLETARPYVTCIEEGPWTEYSIGTVRIRVKETEVDTFVDPTLISLVNGNILLTVSRRDPQRAMVDVWTSGNRVFACRGCSVLQRILSAIIKGTSAEAEVVDWLKRRLTKEQSDLVRQATQQISDLILLEQHEYGN